MTSDTHLKKQKYAIIGTIIGLNAIVSITATIYKAQWYIFLIILALSSAVNSIHVILIILHTINKYCCSGNIPYLPMDIPKKRLLYVLPCYNESLDELRVSIESIYSQINISQHHKHLVIICDGKLGTHETLLKLFDASITKSTFIKNAYKTWQGDWCDVDIHEVFQVIPITIIIKEKNIGKRDSLTMIRRFLYDSQSIPKEAEWFSEWYTLRLKEALGDDFDYIIGTDADTILEPHCSVELLKVITNTNISENMVGVVGFVDIADSMSIWNPLICYQYAEYIVAQCLRRFSQSAITHKVNCLSGCVQIIRVCEATCGSHILGEFNRMPANDENILNHIMSYASEDRNHVCLMFSINPEVQTLQCRSAIAYTHVPANFGAFLRQRKRWNLGAICNDLLLIKNSNHPMWERLCASVNVLMFIFNMFIFIATVEFFMSIITNPSWLMLQISSLILLPLLYNVLIPYTTYQKTRALYYYVSLIIYYGFGSLISIVVYGYTLYKMDDLWWNAKTIGGLETLGELEWESLV
jgi:chitin synthase